MKSIYAPLITLEVESNNVVIVGGDVSSIREFLDRDVVYSNSMDVIHVTRPHIWIGFNKTQTNGTPRGSRLFRITTRVQSKVNIFVSERLMVYTTSVTMASNKQALLRDHKQGINRREIYTFAYKLRSNDKSHGSTRHPRVLSFGLALAMKTGADIDVQRCTREKTSGENVLPKWEDEQEVRLFRASKAYKLGHDQSIPDDRYENQFDPKDTSFGAPPTRLDPSYLWVGAVGGVFSWFGDGVVCSPPSALKPGWTPIGSTLATKQFPHYYPVGMYQSRGFYITTPENRVLVSVVGVLVLVVGYYLDWPGSRQKDMPPVGFVVCLPRGSQPDLSFRIRELNRKYGPLASLKIGSSNVIIIGGDGKLVRELLDKRGSIYSNRPAEPTLQIAGGGDHLLFQQDTEKWRAARKQIVRHYPRASDPEQVRLQEAESVQLLYDFLHDPERHIKHSMRYTTNYGVRCATYDDPVIHGIESIMTRISRPLQDQVGSYRVAHICQVAGVISTAILAQDRARQEIDGIHDEYTLPRWADEERMPFVRAIVRETLRWRPPLPSCVSHRLEQDPRRFNPDRFLGHKLSMQVVVFNRARLQSVLNLSQDVALVPAFNWPNRGYSLPSADCYGHLNSRCPLVPLSIRTRVRFMVRYVDPSNIPSSLHLVRREESKPLKGRCYRRKRAFSHYMVIRSTRMLVTKPLITLDGASSHSR
ncbi:cytochrome P450 domain-containing protein [Rhizoctonia solani AG-1 IA]|uniref:Cytochrome P450 domain-containing protein n=1 Tax=Thanatephorus cucumeris (strain AG1-IA) TaxID=983506 RepID=L8WUF8_THACA|nr:cytochrome P450 domain-containing protein [Rhizoctonia solani AG-1 IA]